MKPLVYLSIFTLILSACTVETKPINSVSRVLEEKKTIQNSLRTDLEKYNGYYSEIESNDGTIHLESLPPDITKYRDSKITNISIAHLFKNESGFNLLFNIDFSGNNFLVVSTIDSTFRMVDSKIYPNAIGTNISEIDTIAIPNFIENKVIIQLMHPSKDEEPSFKVNGIREDVLLIEKNLKINIKQ